MMRIATIPRHFAQLITGSCVLSILLLWAVHSAYSQAPTWQTAVNVGTPAGSFSRVTATAADANGNIFLTGFYKGSATFGSTNLTTSRAGYSDAFVAKWHPATGFIWVEPIRGGGHEDAYALAVQGNHIYVAGRFASAPTLFGSIPLAPTGPDDLFVAKLTDTGTSGTWQWAQRAGGVNNEIATALAVRDSSVYVAGSFSSPFIRFGTTSLINNNMAGTWDVFVAKLRDAGSSSTWQWVQQGGGTSGEDAFALALHDSSVYVAGTFFGPAASFGSTMLTNAAVTYYDSFLAKITDAGTTSTWRWAERIGGTHDDIIYTLAAQDSSVFLAGGYRSGVAAFGPFTARNPRPGYDQVFVGKLTDAGSTLSWQWLQEAGGRGADYVNALVARGKSLYVVGDFQSDTAAFGASHLPSAGGSDIFVARLTDNDSTAVWNWTQQAGGTAEDISFGLAMSGQTLYAGGSFASSAAQFGTTTISSVAGTNNSTAYLAAIGDPLLATPPVAGAPHLPLSLWPNPAQTTVRVTGALPNSDLHVLDALGRTVLTTTTTTEGTARLEVRGLQAGLYLVRCSGVVRRLVVE